MRRAILAFGILAIVAAAQPAGAIDTGFSGRYRLFAHKQSSDCPGRDRYRTRVEVLYIDERVRKIVARHKEAWGGRFGYVGRDAFPWQTNDGRFELRYERRTDSVVGIKDGLQECRWTVRLISWG